MIVDCTRTNKTSIKENYMQSESEHSELSRERSLTSKCNTAT